MNNFNQTRRRFIRTSALGASALGTLPGFMQNILADPAVQAGDAKDSPILVVLQMAGGNDGINTVIPYADDEYHKARPRIKKNNKSILKLNDHVGLNGNLPFLHSMHDEGQLAVVQGVGYPKPNRSHFVSTSIWETADLNHRSNTGWLGRYFDADCDGAEPTVGVSLKKTQPEAFGALKNPGISLSTPQLYQWIHGGGDDSLAEDFFNTLNSPQEASGSSIEEIGKTGGLAGESNLAFLERIAQEARVSSKEILRLAAKHKSKTAYSGTPVSRSLNLVARMIAGGLPTRVYYVSHGGFDTHQNQTGRHDQLLTQLDESLKSFFTDLKEQGNADRVTLMTFSEFGRRVGENASGGTDHGKASCLFVAGQPVKGGVYGKYPSLTDLDNGDLKYSVDFRRVYATVVEDWMKGHAKASVRGEFKKLGFFG